MRLDGTPLAFPAPAWAAKDGILSTSDPVSIDTFIAAARDGDTIMLDNGPSKDDQPRIVPLDGFKAALLLVDAVQGRPGTPGALIATSGSAAPPGAPPIPPAPRWIAPPPLTHMEVERLTRQAGILR